MPTAFFLPCPGCLYGLCPLPKIITGLCFFMSCLACSPPMRFYVRSAYHFGGVSSGASRMRQARSCSILIFPRTRRCFFCRFCALLSWLLNGEPCVHGGAF